MTRRGLPALFALELGLLLAVAGFTALGVWQVHRRAWKLALIEQIDERIHAAPVAAPAPSAWPAINARHYAYRRVRVSGRFLNDHTTLVQAVTTLGGGFWVMTPMQTDIGFTVLVNRGFVPPNRPDMVSQGEGQNAPKGEVTGLLRITEPKGGFLQSNAPTDNRWYSRDVAAIAEAQHLPNVAPYFIDAAASQTDKAGPVGGLTVLDLPNNHLVYAVTWFALAALAAWGAIFVAADAIRPRALDIGVAKRLVSS